jgi:hypothetical protein
MHYTEMNMLIPRRALIEDFRKTRFDEPQCAGFEAGGEGLPSQPTATATPVTRDEDVAFATEGPAGTELLVLGSDGRFSSYTSRENSTKRSDAGAWSSSDDGLIRLCSHASVFRPIEQDPFRLEIDGPTYAKLPALLSALEAQLRENPGKGTFGTKVIERAAARALGAKRTGQEACSCRLLVRGEEGVERQQLQAFVDELDRYLRSGAANLREHRLYSLGSTTWLADPEGQSNRAVIQTLRAFGSGPCILPDVLVRVPMQAVQASLGGATPDDQLPRVSSPAALCSGFMGGAR